MRTPPFRRIVIMLAALLALPGRGASAQTSARPAPKPLFGGTGSTSAGQTALDLTVAVDEAYDQNLSAEVRGVSATPTPYQSNGFYSTVVPSASFSSSVKKLRVNVTGGSNARYYPSFHTLLATNYSVGAGLSLDLTQGTSIAFSQGVTYAPAYLYGLFAQAVAPAAAGNVVPAASNYTLDDQRSYALSTAASVVRKLSPRSSLSVRADLQRTNFVTSRPGYFNGRGYDVGGLYTYSLGRHLGIRVGYTYRSTDYRPDQKPIDHDVDVGLEYNRPLSPTRRTQVGFHVGPTLGGGTLATPATGVVGNSVRLRFIGDAHVDHQLGRTWHARGSYERRLSYIPGLPAPTYSDGASGQVGGFLGRRFDLGLTAAYTAGVLVSQASNAGFRTYSTDVQLRVALSRTLAAYVSGLFYDYTFDPSLVLPQGLPHDMKRSGARAGLTLWLPVIGK